MAQVITARSRDGTDVRAVDQGQGPAILIVHPGLDDGSSWHRVAVRLAPRFRVVRLHRRQYRLDLAGSPWSIAQEVDDVLAIATTIGAPALIVGHSSGGVVALEALAAAPSMFAGAVLYEPPVHTGPAEWRGPLEQARAACAAGKPGRAITIFGRDIVRLPAMSARLTGLATAVVPRLRALAPHQIDDADAIDRLGVRLDTYQRIETPVVLLGGDRSPSHLRTRLDALAGTLPHARTVILRRQGHSAQLRAPGQVAAVIETHATGNRGS